MAKYTLSAQKRELFGKKLKRLRKQGELPGNIFGKDVKSTSVQVSLKDFDRIFKDAGETSVVYLKLEDETKERPVLISNLHYDPVSDAKLHVDFHQVNLKEKVTAHVPVEIIGEPELVKSGEAVLSINLNEIEVEALPTDIPENITFDVSKFAAIGDQLTVADAKVGSDVTVETDPELVVVALSEPQKEEEIPVPEAEPTEGEEAPAGETAEGEEAPSETPKEGKEGEEAQAKTTEEKSE